MRAIYDAIMIRLLAAGEQGASREELRQAARICCPESMDDAAFAPLYGRCVSGMILDHAIWMKGDRFYTIPISALQGATA